MEYKLRIPIKDKYENFVIGSRNTYFLALYNSKPLNFALLHNTQLINHPIPSRNEKLKRKMKQKKKQFYCTAICDILSYYLLKCEFKEEDSGIFLYFSFYFCIL